MSTLKRICMTISLSVKQARLIPQSIMNAIKQRRGLAVKDELEAERLDRIRNPSKYQGR